jgi:hypothetical protein
MAIALDGDCNRRAAKRFARKMLDGLLSRSYSSRLAPAGVAGWTTTKGSVDDHAVPQVADKTVFATRWLPAQVRAAVPASGGFVAKGGSMARYALD